MSFYLCAVIYLYTQGYLSLTMRNDLIRGGSFSLSLTTNGAFTSVQDNVFDNVSVSVNGTTNSYNGYINTPVLPGSSGNDVTNSVFAYQVGPLGRYYQPTNSIFIDKGYGTAASIGLYHFCTTTNSVKDGSTTVDIGPHFIALDANGQPLDTDGDGLPDYYEDRNGNGALDPSLLETDWQTYTTITNNVPGLQVFTPLK